MGSIKQPVDHLVDVMDSWRLGVLGFLTRYSGLSVSGILFTGITMATPWWWPQSIKSDDIGMRGYSTEEIAKRMVRSEHVNEESLVGFAKAVKIIFENDDKENYLTITSTRKK